MSTVGTIGAFSAKTSTRRRPMWLVIAVGLVLGLALSLLSAIAPQGSIAGPAPAEAAVIDLKIKNVGGQGMFVCKGWTTDVLTRSNCPTTSGYLSPGSSTSDLGWPDTDGVQVGTRKKLMERAIVGSGRFAKTVISTVKSCNYGNAYWLKVQPLVTRPTRNFYVENC